MPNGRGLGPGSRQDQLLHSGGTLEGLLFGGVVGSLGSGNFEPSIEPAILVRFSFSALRDLMRTSLRRLSVTAPELMSVDMTTAISFHGVGACSSTTLSALVVFALRASFWAWVK